MRRYNFRATQLKHIDFAWPHPPLPHWQVNYANLHEKYDVRQIFTHKRKGPRCYSWHKLASSCLGVHKKKIKWGGGEVPRHIATMALPKKEKKKQTLGEVGTKQGPWHLPPNRRIPEPHPIGLRGAGKKSSTLLGETLVAVPFFEWEAIVTGSSTNWDPPRHRPIATPGRISPDLSRDREW